MQRQDLSHAMRETHLGHVVIIRLCIFARCAFSQTASAARGLRSVRRIFFIGVI